MEKTKYEREEEVLWDLIFEAAKRSKEKYPCHICRYYKLCSEGQFCYVDYLRKWGLKKPAKIKTGYAYVSQVIDDIKKEQRRQKKCAKKQSTT